MFAAEGKVNQKPILLPQNNIARLWLKKEISGQRIKEWIVTAKQHLEIVE